MIVVDVQQPLWCYQEWYCLLESQNNLVDIARFSVPHLLWHRTSIYNDHLRGHMTNTHSAKHSAVELSLPAWMTKVYLGWDSNTQPSACGVDALTHCATSAAKTTHRNTYGYVIDALYSAWYTSGVPVPTTALGHWTKVLVYTCR